MPERPGTDKARLLFQSSNAKDWIKTIADYEKAVAAVAIAKKRPELVSLDKVWTNDLKKLVESRNPRHILHKELSEVLKWKILRGRFRPLQKLVDSNKSTSVVSSSTKSFELLRLSDWKGALSELMTLHGVGVATASAVLAAIDPSLCPFMADEVIESTTKGEREYTMDAYIEMQANLVKKAKELGPQWNAELVGRALWTEATVFRYIDSAKGVTSSAKKASSEERKPVVADSSVVTSEGSTSRKRAGTSSSTTVSKKSRTKIVNL